MRHLRLENYAAVIPDNGHKFPDNNLIDLTKGDEIINELLSIEVKAPIWPNTSLISRFFDAMGL